MVSCLLLIVDLVKAINAWVRCACGNVSSSIIRVMTGMIVKLFTDNFFLSNVYPSSNQLPRPLSIIRKPFITSVTIRSPFLMTHSFLQLSYNVIMYFFNSCQSFCPFPPFPLNHTKAIDYAWDITFNFLWMTMIEINIMFVISGKVTISPTS